MLKRLFTEPFDVTSTGLITCDAGIKHVTWPVSFTRVCVAQFAVSIYCWSNVGDLSLQCEGKASTMYSGSRLSCIL